MISRPGRAATAARLALNLAALGLCLALGSTDEPTASPPAELSKLARLAFPAASGEHAAPSGAFVVMSDAPRLDRAALHSALADLQKHVARDFPAAASQPSQPVPLIIFAAKREYLAFWQRYAASRGVDLAAPASAGFTANGVATGYIDPADRTFPDSASAPSKTPIRPVWIHEAAHALLERQVGIGSRNDWLSEGLATRCQLAFSGEDISDRVRRGVLNPRARTPLRKLLDGAPIPPDRYWQAASVVDFLLRDEESAAAFRVLVATIRGRDSSNIVDLLPQYVGYTVDELEAQWLAANQP